MITIKEKGTTHAQSKIIKHCIDSLSRTLGECRASIPQVHGEMA